MQDNLTDTTKDKILSFKNLEEGWCYTEGIVFKDSVIQNALILLDNVNKGYKTNAFPGINGEVQLSIVAGLRSLEITIEEDEQLTIVCEIENKELFYKENLTIEQAQGEIKNFCKIRE